MSQKKQELSSYRLEKLGTPLAVITDLVNSQELNQENLNLLKKILLCTHMGRLLINGQPPDKEIPLANYLFDSERVIFDLTRLSNDKKKQFEKWLLEDPRKNQNTSLFSSASINEYRGYTAEEKLNWWGNLIRLFFGPYVQKWKISEIHLSTQYQLLGIESIKGENGILIGFDQANASYDKDHYRQPFLLDDDEYMGNTKRVALTDNMITELLNTSLADLDIHTIGQNPHPLSVKVTDRQARYENMHEYRQAHRYSVNKPWYIRIWDWFASLFKNRDEKNETQTSTKGSHPVEPLQSLIRDEKVTLYRRKATKQIIVYEKRPDIEHLVLCGGGPKIYGHVGVWKALNENGIVPKVFAGTSAGAIISLFCYLGYTADEIYAILKNLKQEHFVNFNPNRDGISDSNSFKTAIDYGIALKVKEITTKYNIPYPKGNITFKTLAELKRRFPDCGIGDELIVTSTNVSKGKTTYFSVSKTPNIEVSQAVTASASIPVIFKGHMIEGEIHRDGGVLNNFPTNVFHDEGNTLLESEDWNSFKTLAVQFDTGDERKSVDVQTETVYRENIFLNWLAGLLSGVKDPASGWEKDRLKLRKYAAQTLLVDVSQLSGNSLTPDEKTQRNLINSGYKTAKEYIEQRYSEKNGEYHNAEYMHSTFSSLEELLVYCCYRHDYKWFENVYQLMMKEETSEQEKMNLIARVNKLKEIYFPEEASQHKKNATKPSISFYTHEICDQFVSTKHSDDCKIFLALYPILLKMSSKFVRTKKDKNVLHDAHHAFSSNEPFKFLKHLGFIQGEMHIVLHVFINLIRELKNGTSPELYHALKTLRDVVYEDKSLWENYFYGEWNLTTKQSIQIVELIKNKSETLKQTCEALNGKDPLNTRTDEIAPQEALTLDELADKAWMWSSKTFV
ncbi:esterase of the alpha-beta hydrolase superfamily protein [Legionella gratiana]|uniref:Esterase of the alpha-beta hydrolase superfamily n=1 Tax=Legionella gratiana TaxID=45066 RepID=A0A378JAW5_9GAMM|nr:Dot/Icm T4SS effector VpdC [Legionella gratiana]KTD15605.1 esterase of the alpha-beta hydrolase superfamily protein [Legionella gratiana]STX44994.1 esterase of the alpha-beta hydrolase superfamily [Legionella gratiana]